MKIIAGQYKGRQYYRPGDIRPTQDVVRKSVMDILGQDLSGIRFLDLFAGSGAMGLEAQSRGAVSVFVERDRKCAQVIQENLYLLDVTGAEVVNDDAFRCVKQFHAQNRTFDMVFADPPYDRGLAKKALKTLERYDILQPNCHLIIEHSDRETLPEHLGRFLIYRTRTFGHTVVSFYHAHQTRRTD